MFHSDPIADFATSSLDSHLKLWSIADAKMITDIDTGPGKLSLVNHWITKG